MLFYIKGIIWIEDKSNSVDFTTTETNEEELSAAWDPEARPRYLVSDTRWSDESLLDKVALSKVWNLTPISC